MKINIGIKNGGIEEAKDFVQGIHDLAMKMRADRLLPPTFQIDVDIEDNFLDE